MRSLLLDYRNPGHLKLSLLCQGVAADEAMLVEVGARYTERSFAYNSSGNGVGARVPGEILLPGGVVSALYRRTGSPWGIVRNGSTFALCYAGRDVCQVDFPRRPLYYDVEIDGGLRVDQLVSQFSAHALALFLRRACHFWKVGKGCRFCSIESTRRGNRHNPDVLPRSELQEAVRIAFALDPTIRYLECSSGASDDLDAGFMEATSHMAELRPLLPEGVRIHLNVMPPQNLELLGRLEPVEEPTFALEVWDEAAFEEMCPGKASAYGRTRFLQAFREGVRLFGEGRLSCNFVAGLEPMERLGAGIQRIADMGVMPQVAIFHPDPGTALARHAPPSVEEMLVVIDALRHVYRAKGYRPYLLGSRRASVDGEVYEGYFDD